MYSVYVFKIQSISSDIKDCIQGTATQTHPPPYIIHRIYTLPNVSYLIFQLANQNISFLIMTIFYLLSFDYASFDVYFFTVVPRFRKFFTQIRFFNVIITTFAFHTISNFVTFVIIYNFQPSTVLKKELNYYNDRIFFIRILHFFFLRRVLQLFELSSF